MAKIINEWPVASYRAESYDWDTWFDGQVRILTYGIDFMTEVSGFRSTIYQAANRRPGIKVRIHSYPGDQRLAVQAYEKSASNHVVTENTQSNQIRRNPIPLVRTLDEKFGVNQIGRYETLGSVNT